MFWGNYATLWWVVIGLAVFSALLIRVGLAHFQREELLGREIDVLNLRWAWRIFRSQFTGNAATLREWYRRVIPSTKYAGCAGRSCGHSGLDRRRFYRNLFAEHLPD
jgi:hypothetical protein